MKLTKDTYIEGKIVKEGAEIKITNVKEANPRMERLEDTLSKVMGVSVELTIRGLKSFTVFFEGDYPKAVEAFKSYMGRNIKSMEYEYDDGDNYIWFEAN